MIRYQRGRFRGGEQAAPGSPRYELGLQQKEDVLHRLVDVWATGEASASLGFAAARLFDELDPLERKKDAFLQPQGVSGMKATMKLDASARAGSHRAAGPAGRPPGDARREAAPGAAADPLVQFALLDSLANVLCPACKLWNTGHGANMMREAVSLMGGYGITEDCPGFLGQKWMDAQLEATYEGPEAVQRRQLSHHHDQRALPGPVQAVDRRDAPRSPPRRPGTGACTLATAMQLWLWTLAPPAERHRRRRRRSSTSRARQGVTFPLADALCWLLAARMQVLDVVELEPKAARAGARQTALPGTARFFTDLCHVQAARAAGEVGRICAELVHGYNRHPLWDEEARQACWSADDAEALEGIVPWPGRGCGM